MNHESRPQQATGSFMIHDLTPTSRRLSPKSDANQRFTPEDPINAAGSIPVKVIALEESP